MYKCKYILHRKENVVHKNIMCELALQLADMVILDSLLAHSRRSLKINCKYHATNHRIIAANFDSASTGILTDRSKDKFDPVLGRLLPRSQFISLVRARTVASLRRLVKEKMKPIINTLQQVSNQCGASPSASIGTLFAEKTQLKRAGMILRWLEPKLGKGVRVW